MRDEGGIVGSRVEAESGISTVNVSVDGGDSEGGDGEDDGGKGESDGEDESACST